MIALHGVVELYRWPGSFKTAHDLTLCRYVPLSTKFLILLKCLQSPIVEAINSASASDGTTLQNHVRVVPHIDAPIAKIID